MTLQDYVSFSEDPTNWGTVMYKEIDSNTVNRIQEIEVDGTPKVDKNNNPVFKEVPIIITVKITLSPNNGLLCYEQCAEEDVQGVEVIKLKK